MKALDRYILEKFQITKDSKIPIMKNVDMANKKFNSAYLAYSPVSSKGKPQIYRAGLAFHKDNSEWLSVAGPYIHKPKEVCLLCELEKGIHYDDNTIVAGVIAYPGYMFIAHRKEDLEQFNDKEFLAELKRNNPYDKKDNKQLKTYLDEHLDIHIK